MTRSPSDLYALARKHGWEPQSDQTDSWWMESATGAMRVWETKSGWVAFEVSGVYETDHEAIAGYARDNGWFQEEAEEQRLLFAKTIVRLADERHADSARALRYAPDKWPRKPFDFACRQCCPEDGCYVTDSVSEGFVCAYHQALKLLESSNG